MLNPDDLVAIDIHTHAEEPCGCHADDGYDGERGAGGEFCECSDDWGRGVPFGGDDAD